ncbi:ABC transporter substrate-binding protein [Aldersonia kunmingensis]|uniref:ABC transporter substrate-binding protein n=1 Tax=Aldersonia kunmingensis TaxID=408066 RepID=UPI001FE0C742|nr:ABC transporter substrate-binding protein [Aldersonia kunmingensis]
MLVALAAITLLVAGCSGRSDDGGGGSEGGDEKSSSAASGDFGDLTGICGPGDAKAATAQGVTADSITVGVFTDLGFNKNPEFVDAANVFTSWCNAAGGINGRKLVPNIHDAKLMEVRQRMIEACRDDFALVGGGVGFDGLGVKERLGCLLPSFPAQVAQVTAIGADLELSASPSRWVGYDSYYGFRKWALDTYPDSRNAVGILRGDAAVTKTLADQGTETIQAAGGTVVWQDAYPASGIADWTPYAQAIKEKGVKGLIFYGNPTHLPKLEETLTGMEYKLDWIDTTNNNYSQDFIDQLGRSAEYQNNFLDLGGFAPIELADEIPALQQVKDMYAEYAPDATITFPAMRAMSAWALFSKAATACGDELTRKCVYENGLKETEWTGGGLHAPVKVGDKTSPSPCFNLEQVTPDGWKPADFNPDNGLYRCDIPPYKYTQDYGKPMTLADVGKSMNDFN